MKILNILFNTKNSCPKLISIFFCLFFYSIVNGQYCTSNGKSTTHEYIAKVEFGNINNPSLANSSGYKNFTSQSTKLTKGNTYEIKITPRWTNKIYPEAYGVWIDFNKDGDFNDVNEQVWHQDITTANTVNGKILIPNSVAEGSTRMRVSMSYYEAPLACGSFNYGEVEDYTVIIKPIAKNEFESNTIESEDKGVNNIFEINNNDFINQDNSSNEMKELLNLVNNARRNNGLAPLTVENALIAAANAHAKDMIVNDFFSHTGSNGSNTGDRISEQGYGFSAWAENIAYGYLSAQSVFDAWMNSPGHRANILSSKVTEIGQVRVQNFWVQVFAKPSGQNRLASNSIFSFETYPNPATNRFISFKGNNNWAEMNYQLISISGAIMKTGSLDSNRLDLAGIANGVYALHLTDRSKKMVVTEKIVVNR